MHFLTFDKFGFNLLGGIIVERPALAMEKFFENFFVKIFGICNVPKEFEGMIVYTKEEARAERFNRRKQQAAMLSYRETLKYCDQREKDSAYNCIHPDLIASKISGKLGTLKRLKESFRGDKRRYSEARTAIEYILKQKAKADDGIKIIDRMLAAISRHKQRYGVDIAARSSVYQKKRSELIEVLMQADFLISDFEEFIKCLKL